MPRTKTPWDLNQYRLLPPLDPDTYSGLKANIAINGVQVPIVRDEKGYILDGFARAKIAKELGYECPSVTVKGLSEQEKRSQVLALNLARRQLDNYAKRQIIADELRKSRTGRTGGSPNRWEWYPARRSPAYERRWVQLGIFPSWVIHSVRTGKYRPAARSSLPTNGDGRLAHELPGAGERDCIYLNDEEGILRAAAEIRQRRVAERLKEIQEKRQQSRPVRIKKRGGPVLHGDCLDLIPTLEDESVSLVVTSATLC